MQFPCLAAETAFAGRDGEGDGCPGTPLPGGATSLPGPRVLRLLLASIVVALCARWPVAIGATQSDGVAQLIDAAQRWMGQKLQIAPAEIRFAPFDARLDIPVCNAGWQFDHPFASQETLRARCPDQKLQRFLRMQAPVPAAPAQGVETAPTPRPAPTPAPERSGPAVTEAVLVTVIDLPRGTRLSPDLVTVQQQDPGRGASPLRDPRSVEHAETTRDLRAGQVLRTGDIRAVVLIKRGQVVSIRVGDPAGFSITAKVEALQDGHYGEQIRLINRESGRILSGRVTGPGVVKGE